MVFCRPIGAAAAAVCLWLQLEETQTKRHDQLVEQYNELLQEIQDLKPKVFFRGLLLSCDGPTVPQ